MTRIALAAAALLVAAAPAQAAAPTAGQQAEFYRICYGISQDDALCRCKADAAMTLIDGEFMTIVIAAMQGKTPAKQHYVAYNTYIGRSNQICKPNY
jgi:hypothetical protein